MLGMNGINYIMLLDADDTGTLDTMFNNDFWILDFVCDATLGCPATGSSIVPSLYKSSQSNSIIQPATVSNPVRVNGREVVTITTSALTQIQFYVAGGIP